MNSTVGVCATCSRTVYLGGYQHVCGQPEPEPRTVMECIEALRKEVRELQVKVRLLEHGNLYGTVHIDIHGVGQPTKG